MSAHSATETKALAAGPGPGSVQDALRLMQALDRSQAIIELALDGTILSANDNFLRLFGYTAEQVVGRHHSLFCAAGTADSEAYRALWRRLGAGEFVSGEFHRVGAQGQDLYIQGSYNPILDEQGKATRVVKFASDVTAVRLQNAEFEAKVKAIDRAQAVIEFDLDGHVLSANRNFLAAVGYTLREIVGKHHSLFCSDAYVQSVEYRDFWLRLTEGQFVSGRFQRLGKFQREVWIQATYNPVLDHNGKVMKVVKYAHDVTAEVQMEQRITARSAEMAGSVQHLLDSITAIAANSSVAADMAEEARAAAHAG